jgi:CheY-like chemotaxis protein
VTKNLTQTKTFRALVIDDFAAACVAAGRALTILGGQVTVAHTGEEALEIVQLAMSSQMPFDLIFTDLHLPGVDGLEAARRMRSLGFNGALIAVTGSDEPDLPARSFAAGCNEFVAKPLTIEKLERIVAFYVHK